jgi:hypothetical protein
VQSEEASIEAVVKRERRREIDRAKRERRESESGAANKGAKKQDYPNWECPNFTVNK